MWLVSDFCCQPGVSGGSRFDLSVDLKQMEYVSVFWVLAAIGSLAMVCSAFSRSRVAPVLTVLFALAALGWAGLWSWLLRDGMAPGFEPSSGLEALNRFGKDMTFPFCICAFISVVGVGLHSLRFRKKDEHKV